MCHFYANKSAFNYFTWYATFIKSSSRWSFLPFLFSLLLILAFLHNRTWLFRIFCKIIVTTIEFLLMDALGDIINYLNIF